MTCREWSDAPPVILAHGFAMGRWVMAPLARRLERAGLRVFNRGYADCLHTLDDNAERLARFCAALPDPRLHMVGHSLGGLLVLAAAAKLPPGRVGRLVLLGSPYGGSHVARKLDRRPWTRLVLGRSLSSGLLAERPAWNGAGELGVIAGTRAIGAGLLFTRLPKPNDGMVLLEETAVPGATDTLALRVSHTEMLISGEVARQVAAFLREGRFAR